MCGHAIASCACKLVELALSHHDSRAQLGCTQGTSQYYLAGSQNISNYRRTAGCPQNRQTFVISARS